MIRLYHATGSRSCRVRWLLEELGQPYEISPVKLRDPSSRTPEYLAKNPLGKVPTLEDGSLVLFESGAIVEYLLETYGKGRLAPAPGDAERPLFLQWLHWSEATLMPPLADVLTHKLFLPEAQRSAALCDAARERFARTLGVVESALAGRDTLLASGFSAADIMTAYAVHLARMLAELPAGLPRVGAWYERLAARPAFQKAFS
jgi:glutathione S-transferase